MDERSELERARELINFACERTGINPSKPIVIEFSNRMTTCMGRATYHKGLILLSAPIFAAATEEQRRTTVIHEAAHLLARGYFGRIKPHGVEWKMLMRRCGEKGERCHKVNIAHLRRRVKRYEFLCYCPTTCLLSTRHFNALGRGTAIKCRTCKKRFSMGDFTGQIQTLPGPVPVVQNQFIQ